VRGEFRRSRLFGLIGVFVVAGIAIVIALSAGSTNPDPKLQMGLIFGVIALFVAVLLILQRSDMTRAAAGDLRGASKGAQEVDDPTKLGDGELWAALAVQPIDDDAIKARKELWGAGFRSLKLGAIIVVLIFLTVPSVYLFNTFIPLLIGGPMIVIAALYGSLRALGPGGEVDSAYDRMDRAMKPLGLSVTERPTVRMVTRAPTMAGYSARLFGPTVISGQRHGQKVEIRQEAGLSELTLHTSTQEFDAKSKGGRFGAADGASNAAAVLSSLPSSDRWRNVQVHGGHGGIVVDRKGDPGAWLCDLWLAERLAAQL
jgi:hypothetical protein